MEQVTIVAKLSEKWGTFANPAFENERREFLAFVDNWSLTEYELDVAWICFCAGWNRSK